MNWQDFLANWKTTLAGIIGAVSTLVVDYLMGRMDLKSFVLAFVIAVLGVIAKDGDMTGTKSKPR